jgi:hypothetical protein
MIRLLTVLELLTRMLQLMVLLLMTKYPPLLLPLL